MSTIIGIDLGTSTTEAAVYKDGAPRMILSLDQSPVIPSAVGIDPQGQWVVGVPAKAQNLLRPENTAIEIKREIGTGHSFTLDGETYTAVELSSRILEYVKRCAGDFLGEEINRAVISVPAYFNDTQRHETLLAGQMAGFQVERIINEPTAAALSYGIDHMDEESHILVYDLGGGTFDVTLLEMFDGILEVKASSGDNALGGKDFDRLLIDRMVSVFRKKNGIDLSGDLHAMTRIRDAAEACKIALSGQAAYSVALPVLAKKDGVPLSLEMTITRDEFEQLAAPLMARTHHPIDVVLSDSGLTAADIDKIILVGGSTRMPMVPKDIEAYLGIRPLEAVDPDFAVAQGASIQAGIIEGTIDPTDGLVITDVNPYSLGIAAVENDEWGRMVTVIRRNVTIPTSQTEVFSTHFDNQTAALIQVYQGESDYVSSNHFLGDFMITGIPARKAREETLLVSFSYDLNGILEVEAVIASTGKKASISIDMQDTHDEPEADNEDEEVLDLSDWDQAPLASEYSAIIRKAERALRKKKTDASDTVHAMLVSSLLDSLKAAILKDDIQSADEIEEHLLEVLSPSKRPGK